MIAFLDACAIIYQVGAVAPYQQRLAAVLGGMRSDHPEIGLAVSRLSWIECRTTPLRERQVEILARYDAFLGADDLAVVELTPDVIDAATELRAEYALKTPDAIQAASALTLGAGTLFVTNHPTFGRVRGLDVKLL